MSEKKYDGPIIQIPAVPEMSLRDYFAAQPLQPSDIYSWEEVEALTGKKMPENKRGMEAILLSAEAEAKLRYLKADAMIAERDK